MNKIITKIGASTSRQLKLYVPASVIERLQLTEGAEVEWTVHEDYAELRAFK